MADAGDGDTIEVVFATLDAQDIVTVHYEPGLTAAQAVERSGLRQVHPSIGDSALILGIYGERVDPDHALNIGDRVEICRALKADPRDMRRDMRDQNQFVLEWSGEAWKFLSGM